MKKEIPFSSIKEITKNLKKRKIIYFGAGNIAVKTNRILKFLLLLNILLFDGLLETTLFHSLKVC